MRRGGVETALFAGRGLFAFLEFTTEILFTFFFFFLCVFQKNNNKMKSTHYKKFSCESYFRSSWESNLFIENLSSRDDVTANFRILDHKELCLSV